MLHDPITTLIFIAEYVKLVTDIFTIKFINMPRKVMEKKSKNLPNVKIIRGLLFARNEKQDVHEKSLG